jgi:superfamily II DNA or RNA helicase
MTTHLGSKGYAIDKSTLTPNEQKEIIKKLWISPIVQRGISPKYPIFRESTRFIYMPRYYGIQHYGIPNQIILKPGEDIDLKFHGQLRPHQLEVVQTYLQYVTNPHHQGGLLELPCAFGKCLGFNTSILMYDGSTKFVQDIKCNDLIMGDDSTPRCVLSTCSGKEKMYKIINTNNHLHDFFICNQSHILSLKYQNQIHDIALTDYLQLPEYIKKEYKGYKVSLQFPEKKVIIDPYIYGYYVLSKKHQDWNNDPSSITIDPIYLTNSTKIRLQLLTGIIDSIGQITDHAIYLHIHHLFPNILSQLTFLLYSLGYEFVREPDIISIYGIENPKNLYISTKKYQLQTSDLTHDIIVEEFEEETYYGFEIDGNRRFVLGNCTVTHNTVLALNIIAELKKKTLVIVHTTFLIDQWIERILFFLPNARIGRIQGTTVDVENKDIVFGMLQSISKGKYPPSTYTSFGLTIIDEVHHISSEVFSKTLFHIVTPYMLGISATMDREDGTTEVIKMFMGDLIYKFIPTEESLALNQQKTVYYIHYKSKDKEFKKTEKDNNGNMLYSAMLSKLSNHIPRSEFILDLLPEILQQIGDKQIILFCEQTEHCHYFHDEIIRRKYTTAGFYMGGMKKDALDFTVANKQIILATYRMASEALDIPTLYVIIYATPRKSMKQSIGRLRNANGLVFDIVDQHPVFKQQFFKKRKVFYESEKYNVVDYEKRNITKVKEDHKNDDEDNNDDDDDDEEENYMMKDLGGLLLI